MLAVTYTLILMPLSIKVIDQSAEQLMVATAKQKKLRHWDCYSLNDQ